MIRRANLLAWGLMAALVALLILGAGVGSNGLESVLQMGQDPVALQIVWDIRLPRTLGAWVAGALLGLAGAVAQGLFRNPLADPYLLGSASGARSVWLLRWCCLVCRRLPRGALVLLGLTGGAFWGPLRACC